jgi:hypothetical protein
LKTPGSGEAEKNLWSNIDHLALRDEVKFVMGSREDYEWSREKVERYDLPSRCHAVLFSPIFGRIDPVKSWNGYWRTNSTFVFNFRCTNSSGARPSAESEGAPTQFGMTTHATRCYSRNRESMLSEGFHF